MERDRTVATSSDPSRRIAFPSERRLAIDTLHLGHRKLMMHGLLEVEVTRARRLIDEHRAQTGQSLSFTAFLLACVGKAVAAHPKVHAVRDWRGRLVVFDDVDACFPLAHVLRNINRQDVRDIHDEIRSVQASGLQSVRGPQRRTNRSRDTSHLARLIESADGLDDEVAT